MNNIFFSFNCCLLLAFTLSTAQADSLGRLFTTPQERASLDSKSGIKFSNRTTDSDAVSRRIIFNGTLISSTGKHSFWVNGTKHENSNPQQPGIHLTRSRQIRMSTASGVANTPIKPGQVLNPDNGRITESFMLKQPHKGIANGLEEKP